MGADRVTAGSVAAPRPRLRRIRLSITAWRFIAFLLILVAWHVASIPAGKLLLPSPIDVAPAIVALVRSGELAQATASSLSVLFTGYALAVLTGIPLGILMGGIRPLGETLEIFVFGINSTPRVAFIPLIVLWFGLGFEAKVVIVWLAAVFPILINTYSGVQNTDWGLIEAGRSFGATQGQIFRHIMLPSALPYVVTGLRLGAAIGVIGTVVAELYTALTGLGHLLALFGNTFQTAKYFVPVVTLLLIGTAISESLKALERRAARWKSTTVEF
ncbi:MAG: ABC transporter permease [Armatimonadota bacterium]|nr:ABC transporter permease [Armatimonadota bacterium]